MRRFLVVPVLVLLMGATGAVTQWRVDRPASAISFTSTGGGQKAEGSFARYEARIRFDPARLDASSAVVAIDLASVSTGQKAVDDMLKNADWFDAARNPQALFTARGFQSLGGSRYAAKGQLKMRGVSVPVTLPFTLAIEGGQATAAGTITIDRTAWGIGLADSMANGQVDKQVTVAIKVKAAAL